jgi:hypothetical protein
MSRKLAGFLVACSLVLAGPAGANDGNCSSDPYDPPGRTLPGGVVEAIGDSLLFVLGHAGSAAWLITW